VLSSVMQTVMVHVASGLQVHQISTIGPDTTMARVLSSGYWPSRPGHRWYWEWAWKGQNTGSKIREKNYTVPWRLGTTMVSRALALNAEGALVSAKTCAIFPNLPSPPTLVDHGLFQSRKNPHHEWLSTWELSIWRKMRPTRLTSRWRE
jgi:hypothetical protein